ncbi:hypothetical protein BCR34DRAFT_606502 [Clohesyomyces aquaticus]|uniref:Uncharacterized protein n=1 Tax=Clohesyomyces aquaticus TaxID=1231657 RepID=A0A1Y1YP79_9PLEO|nr:hypothetical protein BCR34DRAFT_606502 [Clohesyomyces aquaticus]
MLGDAVRLSRSLLTLQDSQAEERLLRTIEVRPSSDAGASGTLGQSLHFAFTSVNDFEALACYWVNGLLLLRLERRVHAVLLLSLSVSSDVQFQDKANTCAYIDPEAAVSKSLPPSFVSRQD